MTPQERTDAVLDFCSDGMYFTSKDIAESLHITPLQARRAIHPLVESGKILAQGNTRARTYRIKRKRARYGLVVDTHPQTLSGLYDETNDGWVKSTPEPYSFLNRPSKWQRIVAFLKGE